MTDFLASLLWGGRAGTAGGRSRVDPRRTRHTLAGHIEAHPDFLSAHAPGTRSLMVYLPPGYETATDRRYPVLYFQDAQNLFDGARAYVPGQEWMLDETAERLIQAGDIEPLIIVGIDHAGAQRVEEFTPSHDETRGQGGGADRYGRMVVEEIKPFIDAVYRTRPDRAMLGGSSLGGLVSLYLGLRHPEVFSALVAVSPSVWWDRRFIVSFVEELPSPTGQRIWLDTGTEEGGTSLGDLRRLRAAFEARGWRHGHDLHYLEAEGAGHSEAAWATRVEPILRWLVPATPAGPSEASAIPPAASAPDPRSVP